LAISVTEVKAGLFLQRCITYNMEKVVFQDFTR